MPSYSAVVKGTLEGVPFLRKVMRSMINDAKFHRLSEEAIEAALESDDIDLRVLGAAIYYLRGIRFALAVGGHDRRTNETSKEGAGYDNV